MRRATVSLLGPVRYRVTPPCHHSIQRLRLRIAKLKSIKESAAEGITTVGERFASARELDPGNCCPDCGGELRLVGEDASEILDMIAAQMKVIEIARLKKSCRCCEKMVQLRAPSRPIPGSMAGAGLLAYILVSKFDDHLPLYRLNEIFARMGVDIPDSTLVDWCGRAIFCAGTPAADCADRGRDHGEATCFMPTTLRSGCWIARYETRV